MAAVPDWPGRPDSASAAMVAANAVPQLSPPAPAATARVAPPAADAAVRSPGAAAGPPGPAALYHGSGADPAAAIIGAARHTLLTKMHEVCFCDAKCPPLICRPFTPLLTVCTRGSLMKSFPGMVVTETSAVHIIGAVACSIRGLLPT